MWSEMPPLIRTGMYTIATQDWTKLNFSPNAKIFKIGASGANWLNLFGSRCTKARD